MADENDPTMQMQALLKSIGQGETEYAPVLEINPGHPIVQKLASIEDKEVIADISFILLDQARLALLSVLTGLPRKPYNYGLVNS